MGALSLRFITIPIDVISIGLLDLYTYFSPVYAGDRIKMVSKLSDIFDKGGGRLQFLVFESMYSNQDEVIVAKSKSTLVVK